MDNLIELFSKQVNSIIERKFYIPSDVSESDFIKNHIMPLKQLIVENDVDTKSKDSRIPVLIVVPNSIVPLSYQFEKVRESINDTQLYHIIKPEWFENAKDVSTPEKPYLLVDDCLDGILKVIRNSHSQCDIYNIAGSTTTTVTTIAEILVEEMGLKDTKFKYNGGSRGWPGDVPRCYISVDKTAKLGWQANHTSTEAVRISIRRLLGKEK